MGKQALKYSSNFLWKSEYDAWQELSKQTKLQSVVLTRLWNLITLLLFISLLIIIDDPCCTLLLGI